MEIKMNKRAKEKYIVLESKMNFDYDEFLKMVKVEMDYTGYTSRELSILLNIDFHRCRICLEGKLKFNEYQIEVLTKKLGL